MIAKKNNRVNGSVEQNVYSSERAYRSPRKRIKDTHKIILAIVVGMGIIVSGFLMVIPSLSADNVLKAQESIDKLYSDSSDDYLAETLKNADITAASNALKKIPKADDYEDLTRRLACAKVMFSAQKKVDILFKDEKHHLIDKEVAEANIPEATNYIIACRNQGKGAFAESLQVEVDKVKKYFSDKTEAQALIESLYVDATHTALKPDAVVETYNQAIALCEELKDDVLLSQITELQKAREQQAAAKAQPQPTIQPQPTTAVPSSQNQDTSVQNNNQPQVPLQTQSGGYSNTYPTPNNTVAETDYPEDTEKNTVEDETSDDGYYSMTNPER